MYITVLWVRSPNGGTGVNAFVYRHPDRTISETQLAGVAADPYTSAAPQPDSYLEVKQGGNNVQAFLDVVLDDREYSPALVKRVLDKVPAALKNDPPDPLQKYVQLEGRTVAYVVFSVNLGQAEPDLKKHIFSLLRETLLSWLGELSPTGHGAQPSRIAG